MPSLVIRHRYDRGIGAVAYVPLIESTKSYTQLDHAFSADVEVFTFAHLAVRRPLRLTLPPRSQPPRWILNGPYTTR
jgi:hypothetical protein